MGSPFSTCRRKVQESRASRVIDAMSSAIAWNDLDRLDALISEGADVNVRANKKVTPPLLYATLRGRDKCIEMLLKSGADVNATNSWGETALLRAAAYGKSACMLLLLEAGADVNTAPVSGSFLGRTPLHMAAGRGRVICLNMLIAAGADVNGRATDDRATPLHLAAQGGYTKCVQFLLTAGADVNVSDNRGRTALFQAAHKGNAKCVKMLTQAGAGVNTVDIYGTPPLFGTFGSVDSARILLMLGSRVNTKNHKHLGIFQYHEENYERFVRRKTIHSVMQNENDVRNMTEILAVFATEDFQSKHSSLQSLSRSAIRKQLLRINPETNLLISTLELGIPVSMVSYLLYEKVNCDEIRDFANKAPSNKRVK